MNKAVFLDRDGTINVDKAYLSRIEDFEYLPGAVEGLQLLQNAGYKLIIVTNQSGIARGYYTEDDFRKLNDWMLHNLKSKGIEISKVYYCPHHLSGKIEKYRVNCDCRKPNLGMYRQAIKDFDIDVPASYSIGDKLRDSHICASTDCKGFLISNLEKPEIIEKVKQGMYDNISYADSLYDAAKMIVTVNG